MPRSGHFLAEKRVKKIVTHLNPDLDAVASCWLIKRFLPGWEKAKIEFIPASLSTIPASIPGEGKTLLVDVGRGKLDHHQTGEPISATELCFEFIKEQNTQDFDPILEKALARMVKVISEVDNALDAGWEEGGQDRHEFYLHVFLDFLGPKGLKFGGEEIIEFGMKALDAVLSRMKRKVEAEKEFGKGILFATLWGKGIAWETKNKTITWLAQAAGYAVAVKKNPNGGGVQIYCRYDSGADLTGVYNKLREMDPESDWFLHANKKLLLNQSSVNPKMKPTKLSLEEIIAALRK